MNEKRLHAGLRALRAGEKRQARRIFRDIVGGEADNAAAWWYLAASLDDAEQKAHCLRQVLRLRPDHDEARKLLAALERQVVRLTPPGGLERPVFDAHELGKGLAVVPKTGKSTLPVDTSRLRNVKVALIVTLVLLAGGLVAAALVWMDVASDKLRGGRPGVSPTVRQLTFGVEACTATGGGEAVLVFVNNTGVPIEILKGSQGQERMLLELEPGGQDLVEALPGRPVRYAIRTEVEGVIGGGAIIEVPTGSTCRVSLQ